MKKILFFSIIVSLLCFGCSNKKKSDLEKAGLRGNIKTLRELSYEIVGNNDSIVKGNICEDCDNLFATYNDKGNIKEIDSYDVNKDLKSKWIYRYNKKEFTLGGNYYFADGSLQDSTFYFYDKKGNQIEYYHYDMNGNIRNKIMSKYDKKGNVIEEKIYDNDNSLQNTNTCKYNRKNLMIENISYDANNNIQFKSTYNYDKHGNMIKQIIYNSDGSINTQGIYKYNKYNDVISMQTIEPLNENVTYTYNYTYDKNHNWRKKITYYNKKPILLTEREIDYYIE